MSWVAGGISNGEQRNNCQRRPVNDGDVRACLSEGIAEGSADATVSACDDECTCEDVRKKVSS